MPTRTTYYRTTISADPLLVKEMCLLAIRSGQIEVDATVLEHIVDSRVAKALQGSTALPNLVGSTVGR
jgi:hypothetical protein